VKFEEVDQFTKAAVITAIGNGAFKGTVYAPADGAAANAIVVPHSIGREHSFAADGADAPLDGFHGGQAIRTDRQPRDVQQWQAADAAIGRE
jgi:hypothetical protein